MGALPAQLEAEWRERHRQASEAAFAAAADGRAEPATPAGSFISEG
jgi:hypothetical protein